MTGIIIGILVAVVAAILLITTKTSSRGKKITPSNAEERGEQGEFQVSELLASIARPQDIIINNIILFNANSGKSSQIDHIFISSSGVYVIETKNYSGYIFGKENEEKWTEVLSNGTKNQFYSPVKQNNSHLYLLRKLIGDKIPMKGLVVFTNGDIRNVSSQSVIDLSGLKRYLSSQNDILLSSNDIQNIYNEIIRNKDSYRISQEEHLVNIKKTQNDLDNLICPRCGKQLVLRSGKYGDFYGCSGYPKCRFIMKNNQGNKQ